MTNGGGSGGGGGGGGHVPSDFNLGLFLGQDDRPCRSPKRVLVTGATGSIGRCVVAQLLEETRYVGESERADEGERVRGSVRVYV